MKIKKSAVVWFKQNRSIKKFACKISPGTVPDYPLGEANVENETYSFSPPGTFLHDVLHGYFIKCLSSRTKRQVYPMKHRVHISPVDTPFREYYQDLGGKDRFWARNF